MTFKAIETNNRFSCRQTSIVVIVLDANSADSSEERQNLTSEMDQFAMPDIISHASETSEKIILFP
jgi:hypothetical protein